MERTFVWLGLSRWPSKDYERLPETAEAMIYGAMSRPHAAQTGADGVKALHPPSASYPCAQNSL